MHPNLKTKQKTRVLREKIKRLAKYPNRKIQQNFRTELWEIYAHNTPCTRTALYVVKEGAHHFYMGEPAKVMFAKNREEFDILKGDSLNSVLVEILKYIAKGRILGPFPRPTEFLNNEKIYFAPIFTIDKSDSTKENPRKRTIIDFSVYHNDPMIMKTCTMLSNKDLIWWANTVNFAWVVDFSDAFWSIFMNLHSLHYNGLFVDDFVYLHAGLPQGAGDSPYWYCFLPKALIAILVKHHPELFFDKSIQKVCSFMDDCFGGHQNIDKTWQQFLVFLLIASLLGIEINWKKVKFPGTYQKILGIMLDFHNGKCSINPKKLSKFIDQVKEALNSSSLTLKSL